MNAIRMGVRSLALLCLVCLGAAAWAQNYPARPVRFVIGVSPGSGTDTVARIIAAGLTETLGQQVIVENRAGASGNIGAEIGAKAPPDGYTLALVNLANAINAAMMKNLPFDLIRDFAPISQVASGPYVIVVHPALPVRSLADFIKLAKSKPGKIEFANAGAGTPTFMAAALFNRQTGINVLAVPYRAGGEAITAILSGEVPVHFSPLAPTLPLIQQNRLRALAVTSTKRQPTLPSAPTVIESGYPGYEFGNWYGVAVPAKTPSAIVTTLHGALMTALKNPTMSRRLVDLGYVVIGDTPEEFSAHIKSEVAKMAQVIKENNLAPD